MAYQEAILAAHSMLNDARVDSGALVQRLAILIAQRDALLKACKIAVKEIDGTKEKTDGPIGTLIHLHAAISAAESGVAG